MKDEEAQVTLRRASGSAAGSSGVETPFQRAPRPNSQPPGSSESGQLRRSVREIRRSFEAGATDSAESSPFTKPLANSRRSFHFEKQSLSWDSSDSDGRRTASNGGTPITSPIKEAVRGSGSKIPVRGGEDKTSERKVDNGDGKANGPSKSTDDPTDGVKAMVSPTHGLPQPRTLNEVVVVQTEFIRIDRREENQEVSNAGESRTIQERFDYVLPKVIEKDTQQGPDGSSSKKLELTNGTKVVPMENEKTTLAERMDEGVGRPSRSAVKANGVPGTPLGGSHTPGDSRSDSPSSQKLSVTDAAESLEKSKSQIDKLQANLKTPLSSETVSTLKAELSTKSKVPMATKMTPIPKSMSLPSRITSYLNGLEKKADYQDQNEVSGEFEKGGMEKDTAKDAEKSSKIDSSPEGKGIPYREKSKVSKDETTHPSDSKSSLRAQFLNTDVEDEKIDSKKGNEDQQKSIISTKTIPVQQVLPLCSPVSTPSKESSPSHQLKTPKDISFSVTSDVSSSEDGAIIVSSVASAVLYPSKANQDLVSMETPMLTNGENKGVSGSWLKEEHYTVENSDTSYKLIKTTTVVSQKPNTDAQESLHIKPTTPRVVGVEIKKGVEASEKDFHQGDVIRKQSTPPPEKDKKHTQIPVLVDRGKKSSSTQAKEEPRVNPKDSSPEKSVVSPSKTQEFKAFLEWAKREELFANEVDVVGRLPDNGVIHVGTSTIQKPASQEPAQKDNREGGREGSGEKQNKETESRNGEASGAGIALDIQRSPSDKVDKNETKSKESPKDEKGGKKMGFMMAVLGGLKDGSKKKKTVPKEVTPKPKMEIKKRRGRVGPPLTEEEIKAMELEAEMRRKKREEEERLAQAKKAEEKAQQKPLDVTPENVNEEKKGDKSPDSLANLLGDDDDERSAVRRDAYAELLKKLAKAGEDQEEDAGGGEETDESRDIGEKTEEDTEGSDTAVEEDEEEDEETVELRRKLVEETRDAENRARGKPPIAPVPTVRTTSLTARSISRAPTSPTIMEERIVTSQMRPTSNAPSSSPVSENVIRSKTASEESIPKRRTLIETAFIGRDGEVPREDHDRQSASSRLLRTPSPGLSRIPHTSMILEERLRRRSESAERGTRRSTSLSPPPVTSPVGRSRGGSNPRYLSEDLVTEENLSPEDIEVDRHRPLKQCLDPPAPQPKKPAKTLLQRILRQSPPPPPPPAVKKQPKSPKLPPLRPRFIYDDSDLRNPQMVQLRDPRTGSLPAGAVPPRGSLNDQRLRSLSPPTTHAEYHAMQVHYQRASLQSLSHYGSQRVNSMSPPPLTSSRAVGAVRPQPLSYSDIPGRMQYDPRSRSLSPQDAGVTRTATLPNKLNLFVRGSPVRTTIPNGEGIAQRKLIAERAGSTSTLPNPIFKRGASSEDSVCSAPAGTKKVSFSCSTPTKAEREQMRMMQLREWQRRAREQYSGAQYDDDVFMAPNKPLPPTPRADEVDSTGRRWLRAATTAGSPRQMEMSPTGISESESGSEAGEVRRIMRRRYPDKDDEWGADGKSRGLPGTDQPGGIPGSRGAVVGSLGGGSGDELEVRRGGGGRPRRDEPRRHTLSHGGSVGGDEVHHHHHHHHHHRGGAPQTGSLARSMDLENNNKMADNGDAFLARMRRKVPLTSTPMTPAASPQLQYIRHQQRPPHPPSNTSLPGYGKTPLPRGSSSGSGSYYPPGMPGGGGGGHGTLDPRSVGHGGMMMGGGGMMYEDDDPGIMSEVETASTGFRRGGKQRSSLPVVRTPSKTLERPLGLVFLQYRNETKRALLPNEITSIDTVKALFVRSFPKQLTMEYLDSPLVKIYIHDSSKDMFYELEDLRSHLRDIRDRSVLRLFESDVNGGPGGGVMPGGMVPVPGPSPAPVPLWDQDQSYFSEPEFDSEYHHQHIHKTKGSKGGSGAPSPYYMTHSYPPGAQPGQPGVVVPPGGGGGPVGGPASSATLPRGPLLRAYSPATERIKPMPPTDRMHGESGYMSSPERGRPYPPYPSPSPAVPPAVPPAGGPPGVAPPYEDPYYGQYGGARSGSITPVIDEEASLYGGVKMGGRPLAAPQARPFPPTAAMPAAAVPYDVTRIRVEHMERQLANLTGLVQKALTQGRPPPGGSGPISGVPAGQPGAPDGASPGNYLQVPASRDAYRNDETYIRSDTKPPKLGKGRDKSVSFEKSVSFSDEPPDMSSPKQHSPQHAERDHRHKPAPPPKPVSLSPGQYEGRHIYRDLHLTPEMYNQLRILQRKAKDLRQEVRNLRRMSQAQAHSVRETIRDTFIKIRAMLLTGGETWLHQQQLIDADRLRTSREEELYKQEMLRLEKDLTELESTVEELRGNVINRKTRVNMSDVENMALILSKSSKTVADLKVRFPSLQDGMKSILSSEMEKVVREEKFLKEEPERLENALRRCKKLTGTLVTLKRLASVQEQRLPSGNSSIDARLSPTLTDGPALPVGNERGGSVSSSLGSPVSGSPGPNSKFLKVGRGASKP